jgi:hypothetical protein
MFFTSLPVRIRIILLDPDPHPRRLHSILVQKVRNGHYLARYISTVVSILLELSPPLMSLLNFTRSKSTGKPELAIK